MNRRCFLIAALTAACAGADPAEAPARAWLDDVEAPLPELVSQTGMFVAAGVLTPSERVVLYTPRWPLWSSGADKQRLLFVPDGALIDASGELWSFPVGTVIAKSFSFEQAGAVRAVETRLLFQRAAGWDYALYRWRDDGADAELVPGNWPAESVDVEPAQGAFAYTLPGKLDCRTCHETASRASGTPVLGVTTLQLDPLLAEAGVFSAPPEAVPVSGRDAIETDVLGYFVGNCIHCHDGSGEPGTAFGLHPEAAVGNLVDQPTTSPDADGMRVTPGDPQASVLYQAVVLARDPVANVRVSAMPPLGVDRVDPSVGPLLVEWIEAL